MSVIIETQDLSKVFNKGESNEVVAVAPTTLRLEAGSCTLLQGPSGSGKTTLLTLLSCLSRPTEGEYYCLQEQVSKWSEKFLTRFRRENLGMVFQQFNLLKGFSVAQNIAMPLWPLGFSSRELEAKAQEAANKVNIGHRFSFPIDKLSGGELQRVAIARGLVATPRILFADEPTAHLDRANSESILHLFEQLKSQGTTLIITTHDPLVSGHPMVDQTITMVDGKVQGIA